MNTGNPATTSEARRLPQYARSRRDWLIRSFWIGGALAGFGSKVAAGDKKPLPWNDPFPLGHSGLLVTRLGFGCEEAKDPELIRQAADLGINHFNSFPNRGDITNFPVVGKALRPLRSRVILATGSNNRTPTGLLDDLDRQLQALGTDYVDLFYLVAVSKAEALNDDLIEALKTPAGRTRVMSAALRWVLQNELVDTVPLLIKSQAELAASTKAAAAGLNEEDEKSLTAAVRDANPDLCRLCPTCRAQCRLGFPIPEVMRALMYACGYGDIPRGMRAYAELAPAVSQVGCGGCSGCTAHCPNGVQVRAKMLSAHGLLSGHTQPNSAV